MAALALTRRVFLADIGRGAFAIAVLGIAGCAPSGSSSRPSLAASSASSDPGASSSAGSAAPSASGASSPPGSASAAATTWTRVNLGFVSAYLLVRAGEAAIVDTGIAGSEDEIAAGLTGVGLDWSAVGHVILTHRHPDHAGSINAVLDAAPDATGYIGTGDLDAVQASRPLTAVDDGATVFGLKIIGTPGHTLGHVSVLDEAAGALVAGDALRVQGGSVVGSNPPNTADMAMAEASVVKMGKLTFETLLVGHGEPILTGASAAVAKLAGG